MLAHSILLAILSTNTPILLTLELHYKISQGFSLHFLFFFKNLYVYRAVARNKPIAPVYAQSETEEEVAVVRKENGKEGGRCQFVLDEAKQ